jgi:outer membrane protein TolC
MKWIIIGLGVVCVLMPTSRGLKAQDTTQMRLQGLIKQLATKNPQLQSARFSQQSAEAAVPAARSLPDPVLGFSLMNLPVHSFAFNRVMMTGKKITLTQHFPFPGKRDIKENIAQEGANIKQQKVHELRNQLMKKLKVAYYQLFYVDRALATVQKSKKIMQQLISAAETKYKVGKGVQQDVLRAQLELSKLIDKKITLHQKRLSLASQLNTLINVPPEWPVATIPNAALQMRRLPYSLAQLKEVAGKNRPLLAAWHMVITQSETKTDLAKKQLFPDFSVGVGYTQRDVLQNGKGGIDFFSAMFSVSLPIYHKRKQGQRIQEAKLKNKSAQAHYQNVLNNVYQQLRIIYTKLKKNEQLVNLYKSGAIPQARQSFQSAMAAYQNNEVDFLTLLNSELALFHTQLTYYRALSDYNKNIAVLEAITGMSLTTGASLQLVPQR